MDGPDAVVAKLKELNCQGAIVAQSGQLDTEVDELIAAGWTWDEEIHYVAGKRIRVLKAP